jgi:hypothetical protein
LNFCPNTQYIQQGQAICGKAGACSGNCGLLNLLGTDTNPLRAKALPFRIDVDAVKEFRVG